MIDRVWNQIQPFALHPIQRAGLDEAFRELFEDYFSRPELYQMWLGMYG